MLVSRVSFNKRVCCVVSCRVSSSKAQTNKKWMMEKQEEDWREDEGLKLEYTYC